MRYINHIQRLAVMLILLMAGWAGCPVSAQTVVEVIPDPSTNLVGSDTGTAIQPLESWDIPEYGVTLNFSVGSGRTNPAYYYNGANIRLYNGNTFTIETTSSYIVESVLFHTSAYKSDESTLSSDCGEVVYDAETLNFSWNNPENNSSVTFNIGSSQFRMTGITLTLRANGEVAQRPKAPVLSQTSCNFYKSFELTITDVNDDPTTIKYTLDGSEPSADNGQTYTAPVVIPEGNSVTIKAVCINENGVSAVTQATYSFTAKHLLSVVMPNKSGISYVYYSSNTEYGEWYDDNSTYITDGENVYIGFSLNSGYKCRSVLINGVPQSVSSNYFEFVMPSNDVEIVIDAEFDPSSPSDPQPGEQTKKYTLSLVCNPIGAASLSGAGTYTEGSSVYVYASNNSGYVFTGWSKDGEAISGGNSMSITMPASDVVLTANFAYNPSNPTDPQQPTLKHPLTVIASPAGAGTFNTSGSECAYGQEYYVYAYPQTGYRFKGWVVNGVAQENTSTAYYGTMTDAGAQVVGLFVFDPVSPSNPGANYYNSVTGQAIVDDFTSGNLYSAIRDVVGYDNFGNVSSIIVKGQMNSSDFSALRNLTNAGVLDLSRTGGYSEVPGYAFENVVATDILLPSSISNIGSYVFRNCANLISLTVYAQEPPKCSSYTFSGFTNKANCTVYVPASAIELYSNADYWKDFTILPITNDAHVLQVNLPADASDGKYKNNSLEIVNINSGVRQKYVISDRLIYTFNGLQKDEQYNIYMFSQAGLEIGRIENVVIPDQDIEVTFDNLKSLHTVYAKVLASDGTDVTNQVGVEWLKPLADGTVTYLRKAVSLGEIPEGQQLICRVSLDNKLGVVYTNPEDVEFTVGSDNNTCIVNLIPFRAIELSGSVVDGEGIALSGVSVSVNQTLNGKFSKTYTAKTDRKGQWNLSVLDAPETRLTYAASECVNVNDAIGAFAADVKALDLGKTTMKSIVGARVSYGFTYHAAGSDDVQDYYSDYQNVAISVFNVTQNRAHKEVSLQYPILAVLDENINAGDELKLTATSKTGAFNPIEETVTVGDNQRAEVTFDIVGKGGISASFEMTENPAVIAMLYTGKGELLKKMTYSEAKATFTELEDGDYTLVSMGQSDLMNSILRLSNFAEIGLTEGKDYVKNVVKVESGKLAEVKIQEVPAFDESLFYYTNASTSFSSNKSSITTGNYLTLRSAIDFKGVYKNDISNVALIVDLPEACDFVEQSVIQGPNLLPYTLDNNRLTVQLGNNYQSQTRFCVIPTTGGSFNATASIVFDYNGKTLTQPIGSAASEIKDIEITVPSVVADSKFKVSGTSIGNSEIKIFENGTLIGSGKANAAGSWNVDCELVNPYNMSTHQVFGEITTPSGIVMVTETKGVTYDINALQVSKVTMYHWNPEINGWKGRMEISEFDFLNPKTSASQWTVYYPKKIFTYTIEFTSNDPERISNVILYVHTADGKFVPCPAKFDEQKGFWYAEIDMGTSSDGYYPVNCSVDFDFTSKPVGDSSVVNDAINNLDTELETSEMLKNLVNNYVDDNYSDINRDLLFEYLGIDQSNPINEPSDLRTFFNEVEALLYAEESISDDGVFSFEDIDGNQTSFICDYQKDIYLSSDELLEFNSVELTDGTTIYIRETNCLTTIYYSNILVSFGGNNIAKTGSKFFSPRTADEFFTKWSQLKETLNSLKYLPKVNEIISRLNLEDIIADMRNKLRLSSYYLSKYYLGEMSTAELSQFDPAKAEKYVKELPDKIERLSKILGRLRGLFKAIDIAGIINDINTARESRESWNYLIESIESSDCPGMEALAAKARNYRDWVARGYTSNISVNVAACVGSDKALGAIVAFTAKAALGVELSSATIALWAATISTFINDVNMIQGGINQINDIRWQSEIQNQIPVIKCPKDCGEEGMPPCPEPNPNGGNGGGNGGNKPGGGAHQSGSPSDGVQIDPSGYVYEAVPENRVENVQASIYYKETKEDMYGDPYEDVILWNAEEYAQKNPLFTDENGMYRWDVPQGLWQVKFEKDGYQTAYSEWLPVPPPQLDVNIGIVQNKQPEVTEARAYEEGVEVQFDKFMDLSTLTTANIYVTANGEKLNGEILFVDSELADEYASEDDADAVRYASRVRFVPEEKLSATTGEIRVTVSRNVLSYAGIPMTETFSQVLDVEKEVQIVYADDVKVLYGGEKEVTVYAMPYEAAIGRKLHIANSSDLIASIDITEATLDEEGKAVVTVKGDLPGRAQLTFTIDDVTATGECAVDVVTEIITAEAPKSSRASGTAVYRGTKVELTSESKNATIYFTTDGSCPCDENGTRRKYTVPIIINEDTRILAMTSVGNGDDDVSETVEFNYTLKRSDMDFQMPEGWTWMSHNFESAIAPADLSTDEGISRILSQTQEVIRDPQLGMVGTLQELSASESYKVETTTATTRQRLSDVAWNPATPISLNAGWNWLGYPVSQTMSVDEAFATTNAETLDVVVGQNGFAQFDGENWVGSLETMSPGMGYMYQSQSAKSVVYNTSIVSTASAKYAAGISKNSPLVLDIHKYGTIMPVVATINNSDGSALDNDDYQVAAFCGSECRGIGRVVKGLVMMNVYGNDNDAITFHVTDADGENSFDNNASLNFSETVVGDVFNPYAITINNQSGIADVKYEGNIKVTVDGDMLRIKGIPADNINLVEVYDINGQKLIHETRVSESGIRISTLTNGVYVVIVSGSGEYTYHKIAVR